MSSTLSIQAQQPQQEQVPAKQDPLVSQPRPRAQLMESRLTDAAAAWLCAPFPNLSVAEMSDSLVRITDRLGSTATEFLHALVLFYRFYARVGSEVLLRIRSMSELLYVVVLFLEVASKFSRENAIKYTAIFKIDSELFVKNELQILSTLEFNLFLHAEDVSAFLTALKLPQTHFNALTPVISPQEDLADYVPKELLATTTA